MSAVMLERDAVMAAVRGLLRDALGGRGGTLFVAGEAGLGKTTVLRYAVAAAGDRFRTGTGQADVGEAALPFGLIGQALDPLLGSHAATTGTARAPADYFYAVLARLRQAASQPLFLALDDAHWADPDSLTLLRLICRRITELPVAVLVTARPWPPEALRAGEELAASHLAEVQHLAPLSAGAARSMLQGTADVDRDRVAALCAGNPLLLGQVAAALRAGEGIPDPRAQAPWSRRLLLSHLAGLSEPARGYLQAAAVLGRRFRPEVAAQVAGLAAADAAAAQEAFAVSGLGRDAAGGWAEFGHELIRQAIYELAAPVRARLHESAFRVLAARGDNPGEDFLVPGDAGLMIAGGDQGPAQVEDQLGRRGRPGQVDGRFQVAACRAHGADRQRLPASVGRDRHGLWVASEPGRHRVPCRLARVVPAGRQDPERGLVQARPDRGGQLVDGLADQLVAELGPASGLVAAKPGGGERFLRRDRVGGREPGHLRRHFGPEPPAQHRRGPQVLAGRLAQAD